MIVSGWTHPTWTSYLGFYSPRGSASVSTLVRRMSYGGRKGRRAERRLYVLWRIAHWTVGIGAAFELSRKLLDEAGR